MANCLVGLKVIEIPKSFSSAAKTKSTITYSNQLGDQILKSERYLRSLCQLDIPIGYRILIGFGQPSAHHLSSISKAQSVLSSTFAASFPNVKTADIELDIHQQLPSKVHVSLVYGIPVHSQAPLDPMLEILHNSDCCSMYQTWSFPASPGWLEKQLAKYRYKSVLERAGIQEGYQDFRSRQITRPSVDVHALRKKPYHEAAFHRAYSDKIFEVRVILACWGASSSEQVLRTATSALLASVSSMDKDEKLKARYLSGKKALQALKRAYALQRKGKSTRMTPREAVPYYILPTTDLGLSVSSPASFSSSRSSHSATASSNDSLPFTQAKIALGHVVRNQQLLTTKTRFLPLKYLPQHIAILGLPGFGKSTTKNRIIIDAWNNGIPSLIIEPVKTDARILCGAIAELRVFTLGNESVAPFRINPFWIPEANPIQLHINLLYSCFLSAWPLYGILANHLRRVISQTYTNRGWDPVNEVRGQDIQLEDFLQEARRYSSENLHYGSELAQDFRGAIIARAEDLCDPSRAVIFNTTSDLPTEELLSKPTIIELEHLGDPQFTSFVLSLLLTCVYEHFKRLGPSKELLSLLVIDEAHRVLEELPKTLDMSEHAMAKRMVIDQQVNIISESRSYGLGVILAEQIATRLARDALKNCSTKIVHRITSPDDRELMALETGCNEEQAQHIGVLALGEVIFRGPEDHVPSKLKVFHDPDFIKEMNRPWTDTDIRERMKAFYDAHPDFAMTPTIPDLMPLPALAQEHPIDEIQRYIEEIVQTIAFRDVYREALERLEANPASMVLEEVVAEYAISLSYLQASPLAIAEAIIECAAAAYGQPTRNANIAAIQQMIKEDAESSLFDEGVGGGHAAH